MNERDLWWKIVFVGVLTAFAWASVFPLDTKVKWGIDLAGGYSLLYEIDDTGLTGTDRSQLSKNVMSVLQKRVDPQGVFNLVWRPIGHNRIEIQMPRQAEEVTEARKNIEQYKQELQDSIIRRSQVLSAVARDAADRPAVLERLAGGDQRRTNLLQTAATAYDELKTTEADYEARKTNLANSKLERPAVEAWAKLPKEDRDASIDELVAGIEGRRSLLNFAAQAWDRVVEAQEEAGDATTQPADRVERLERMFATNINRVVNYGSDVDALGDGVTIDTVIEKQEALDQAVAAVLATNVQIDKLQIWLESDSDERPTQIASIKDANPELEATIDGLVSAYDDLNKKNRKAGGRLADPADLQRLLRGAGVLEFRILPTRETGNTFDPYREDLKKYGPRPQPGEEVYQWFEIEDAVDFLRTSREELAANFEAIKQSTMYIVERFGDRYYVLAYISDDASMTRKGGSEEKPWSLKSAYQTSDESGRPAIGFRLDEIGGSKFARLTRKHRGGQLCIFLDDQAVSSATINDVIRTSGIIMGNFTPQYVQDSIKKLNAGSLPQKVKDPPISVRAIGPQLGQANKDAGLRAAMLGSIFVALFMLAYYFYAGGIAVIAVGINILLIGAMMSVLGATMTLPGIAGLVLAIGMAVDANVLINERIREELKKGTAMRMAIKLGYERAFRAILDSNVTTVLTCVILYVVGSEQVKGFGLTLGVGVFINIFTAYFITRMFFDYMSMLSVPSDVKRLPVVSAIVVAGIGLALYAIGYFTSTPETRAESVGIGFGSNLMLLVAPCILGVLILMLIFRSVHKDRKELPMLSIIGIPKVDWVAKRGLFFTVSGIVIAAGIVGLFGLKSENIFDIEFLGGTSAQIELLDDNSFAAEEDMPTQISDRLAKSADALEGYADQIKDGATVEESPAGLVLKSAVAAGKLDPILRAEFFDELNQLQPVTYDDPNAKRLTLTLKEEVNLSGDDLKKRLSNRLDKAAAAVRTAQVQTNSAFGTEDGGESYTIVSRETSKEIVVAAILENMAADLKVKPSLSFEIKADPGTGNPFFPLASTDPRDLNLDITDTAAASIDLTEWQGGVAIVLDNITPARTLKQLSDRLDAMRLQPGFEQFGWRESEVFGLRRAAGGDTFEEVMVVVADENYPLLDKSGGVSPIWQRELAQPEVELIEAALQQQQSLQQVTQFDNQVSGESQIQAGLALALSWLLIIVFVWIRFGNIRWGLAAVAALVHDVLIALSAVAATYYIAQFVPAIGNLLMIDKVFRIDLAMVAAFLTVVGYSVNDTIIVFDRVRENRGRQADATPAMVNESINQTLSRTMLTLLTSLITVFIMYAFGGDGIHSFNYVLLIGLAVGTYSSIGIASQFLLRKTLLAKAAA